MTYLALGIKENDILAACQQEKKKGK